MELKQNAYYTTTNSNICILVLSLDNETDDTIDADLVYLTKSGRLLGTEKVTLKKANLDRWIQIPSVPFSI